METPSSTTRRVTRSQTMAAASASKKIDETETKSRKMSGKKDRSALIDITNDSPIVGLAMGKLETPSSAVSKKRIVMSGSSQVQQQFNRTPGSGEALLRGQVKTLLQKVEEEAVLSKITLDKKPFFASSLHGIVNSPVISLVAPTPANTPQILGNDGLPVDVNEMFMITENVSEENKVLEGIIECEDMVTRSLLLDFSEKSDSSECSSVVTYQGALYGDAESSKADDDDSSIWSIQVNASSTRDDDDADADEVIQEEEYDDSYGEEEEYGDDNEDGLLLDELCEGISNINVEDNVKFSTKHIRFVYNSDDEIEGETQVLHLKGLPTPQGKHLQFPTDDDCC